MTPNPGREPQFLASNSVGRTAASTLPGTGECLIYGRTIACWK